jgi:hypothetical protein
VVRTRPEGRTRMLSLRKEELDERFPGLLDAVLSAEPSKPVAVRSNGATAGAA